MLADVVVVALDVLLEGGAVPGEVVSCRGHGHDAGIEKIRCAPHHPAGRPRPVPHHGVAPLQVAVTPRGDERQPNRIAGGRRHIGHLVPERRVVLHVVEGGEGPHAVAETGVARHVLDPLALHVDLGRLFSQPGDVGGSRPGWHARSPSRLITSAPFGAEPCLSPQVLAEELPGPLPDPAHLAPILPEGVGKVKAEPRVNQSQKFSCALRARRRPERCA